MLRIVTGPFHPALDRALVEDIRSLKAGDPFAPCALIAPSATLVDRLKRLLAIDARLPVLNLHVLTFHQLALRLQNDLVRSGLSLPPLQLVDDFYSEQLVRQVVLRKLPGLEPLTKLPSSPGTWKGLWVTIRDLKDAVVRPDTALKAVSEGLFEEDDRSWLQALFTLQAAVVEGSRSLGVGSPDDLALSLTALCPQSPFLSQLKGIFYYGFYDLSQVQLSFFDAVTRCAPATLYFPLEPGQTSTFARRFFDRHLLPLAGEHEDLNGVPAPPSVPAHVELSVTNVIGAEEELSAMCRGILELVEVHGYRFDDIGVVARSLEPYQARLQQVFDRHLVPFTSTAGRPLLREPLVKMLLRLASLPVNDFERSALLDVMASPFYRTGQAGDSAVEPRPDIWRSTIATLGITKGRSEWSRLSGAAASSILDDAAAGRDEEAQPAIRPCDPEQLSQLSSLVSGLIRDCERLPGRGPVGRLTEAFLALVDTHVAIPGWTVQEGPSAETGSRDTEIGSLIRTALDRLQELEPLGADLSWEEWTEWFRLALEECSVPVEEDTHRGVQVLDAMSARGLQFRALFIIGLNEQIFPRFVREDPFLRDRQRVVLESTLGFKIDEKLAGHEEERLLFDLLSKSATHRLLLSYQRADEDGRMMAPSPFVAAAQQHPRFIASPEVTVPRRLTTRVALQPTIQDRLPAQDLALSLLLHERDAGPVLNYMGQDRLLFEEGRAVQQIMERESPELGSFDGILDSRAAAVPALDQAGISPTSLERYAICPFQYFAEKVLRLESVRAVQEEHLPALTLGTLLHDSLRLCYERLVSLKWPETAVAGSVLHDTIAASTREIFARHAVTRGTGHALLWTMAQEQIIELIAGVIRADQEDYRATGFRPHAFEAEAEGVIQLGTAVRPLKVHGKLDRIDRRADPPGLRIVDYKFKQGSEAKTEDRNLLLAAVRGIRLQPPLYASMTFSSMPAPSEVQFFYLAPRWKNPIARSVFDASRLLAKSGEAITQTIRTLVQGISRGEFFILPDGYCEHCAFPAACRRHDGPTWWRSYRSPQARVLRRLRKQKVADE